MTFDAARATRASDEEGREWAVAARRALQALVQGRDEKAEETLFRLFGNWRSSFGIPGKQGARQVADAAEVAVDRLRNSNARLTLDLVQTLGRAVRLLEVAIRQLDDEPGDHLFEAECASIASALRRLTPRASSIPASPLSDLELFLSDSSRRLDECAEALSRIERPPPAGSEAINGAFRALHTFKGNVSMLGYVELESLARAGENALGALRSGDLLPSVALKTALLRLLEKARSSLTTGSVQWNEEGEALARAVREARHSARRTRLGALLVEQQWVEPEDVELALSLQREPLGQALVRLQVLSAAQLDEALVLQAQLRTGSVTERPSPMARRERVVPVDLRKLEKLAARVHDLEQAHAWLQVHIPEGSDGAQAFLMLGRRIEALDEALAATHRLPFKATFARLARHARSLAEQQGKLLDLTVKGHETEIARAHVDALSDALLHVVRNAVDHGVEPPAERRAQSKPERATLLLEATVSNGTVRVVVSDDGRGIDALRIRDRVVSLGLAPAPGAADLAEDVLLGFLFAPGFSTREEVSDISGRGVGLDSVRHRITEIGGRVSIVGTKGVGATVTIELPATEGARLG